VAFTQNSRSEVRQIGGDGQVVGALAADAGAQQQNYIAFPANLSCTQHATTENLAPAMGAKNPTAVMQPLPLDPYLGGEVTIAIDASYAKGCGGTSVAERPVVAQSMQVRRLTPTECERLQGFPDGYTAIPWRGKTASECPDGPRYKALGNSWAVPVVRWIGRRIHDALCK